MENFYKRDICYIRMFSFALTQFILYTLNFAAGRDAEVVPTIEKNSWDCTQTVHPGGFYMGGAKSDSY